MTRAAMAARLSGAAAGIGRTVVAGLAHPSAAAGGPSRSAITSSMRRRAAPIRSRHTAISSVALATRSASWSTSTSLRLQLGEDPLELGRARRRSRAHRCCRRSMVGHRRRSCGSGRATVLASVPVGELVTMTSPAATTVEGERTTDAVGAPGDRPPAREHRHRVERSGSSGERLDVPLLGGEHLSRSARRAATMPPRRRRSAPPSWRAGLRAQPADPLGEALVGAADGGMGAPGDAVGAVGEALLGTVERRGRRRWPCS